MRALRAWFFRLAALFDRKRRERELSDELESHLQLHIEDNLRRGMTPVEARRQALIKLGGLEQSKEIYRDRRGIPLLESLIQDLRYGLRMLAKSPGFTGVAVLTLALGIGGTTTIFSVIEGAVLHPFAFPESHRLVKLTYHDPRFPWPPGPAYISDAEFLDYQEQNRVFDEVFGGSPDGILVTGIEAPFEVFNAARVTGNFFRGLGVPPLVGRPLTDEDSRPGSPPVAVLSQTVWQSKFGGDPGIVGRTLILNRQPTTVVGVMPYGIGADISIPAILSRSQSPDQRQLFWLCAHLRPGVSLAQAAADVAVLSKSFAVVYGHKSEASFGIKPINDIALGSLPKTLYILLGAVGLLLLIACVNVANLLLARATARDKETAIRASLGASRGRLVRQFIIESLLLALAGAGLGCFFAWSGLDVLVSSIPPDTLGSDKPIRINDRVLLFTLSAALLSTLLFGLAPALLAVRKDLQAPLKASGRGAGESLQARRLRNLLVVGEVALSLVLLTGAGLLIRSFFTLQQVQPGYSSDHVLSAWFNLPKERYQTVEQKNQFNIELLRRVRGLPGVVSAALGWPRPTGCCGFTSAFEIDGKLSAEEKKVQFHRSSDRFFETLNIRLLQGRSISEEDFLHSRKVAVVNQRFVARYLNGENPVGRQITLAGVENFGIPGRRDVESLLRQTGFEIIGVVPDIRDNGPEKPPQPAIYVPYTVGGMPTVNLWVRTIDEPARFTNVLRREVAAMDKELPLGTGSMEDDLKRAWYSEPRFVLTIMAAFAALGLALVLVGVYGVLSYSVSQRTHEIGVRMALGAQAADVRRMVLRTVLGWLGVGIGIGVPASMAVAKILQNRIWGIKSADPLTLGAVALLLTAVGLAACYIPARRATKVDPMVALRFE